MTLRSAPSEYTAYAGYMNSGDVIGGDLESGRRLRIDEIIYQPEHSMRTQLIVRD